MTPDESKKVVKVNDKRRTRERRESQAPSEEVAPAAAADEVGAGDKVAPGTEELAGAPDYLGDLKRVQAEFDNYRKRVMRDQANVVARATARVIEGLLPIVDNFERAISHGEGGEGVELVFKELTAALEREGLEEVPAEGVAFDPNVHEAVESRDVDGLEEPACIEVFRRGYTLKGQLLRPALVVVGRPATSDPGDHAATDRDELGATEG